MPNVQLLWPSQPFGHQRRVAIWAALPAPHVFKGKEHLPRGRFCF